WRHQVLCQPGAQARCRNPPRLHARRLQRYASRRAALLTTLQTARYAAFSRHLELDGKGSRAISLGLEDSVVASSLLLELVERERRSPKFPQLGCLACPRICNFAHLPAPDRAPDKAPRW